MKKKGLTLKRGQGGRNRNPQSPGPKKGGGKKTETLFLSAGNRRGVKTKGRKKKKKRGGVPSWGRGGRHAMLLSHS